jgi:hypothetical protein
MTRLAIALVLALTACNSSSSCLIPAAANQSGDGGATGCSSSAGLEECEVMEDGSQRCTDHCSPSEYGLFCVQLATADASLHCRSVLFGHGPQGASQYCCPCS